MQLKQSVVLFLFFCGWIQPFWAFAGPSPTITLRGQPLTLVGQTLAVGQPLPDILLPDAGMNGVKLNSFRGQVTLISIVPSIDTKVCEKQTHILSEENNGLDATVRLVTISRDLPFAQKRFSENANIKNVLFLSDYRGAQFGRNTGLLIKESQLLARAVLVLDKEGIIRYLEIVPELAQLPKMQKAFDFAKTLGG